jgi:hypothetical protein
MLFAVKRQWDVAHMAELQERYLMKVHWLADSIQVYGTCKYCCILGVALDLQKGDYCLDADKMLFNILVVPV